MLKSYLKIVLSCCCLWGCASGQSVPKYASLSACGVQVELTQTTQFLTQSLVDRWCGELVDEWAKHVARTSAESALPGWKVVMVDQEYLEHGSQKAHGFTFPDYGFSAIATKPSLFNSNPSAGAKRVESLFKHELSHVIVFRSGIGFVGDHHELFKQIGLPF